MKKNPSHKFNLLSEKTPKSIEEPANYKHLNVSWQIGIFDLNSEWGLHSLSDSQDFFENELIPKLKNFETNSWNEVERQMFGREGKSKHHSVEVSKLSKKAQKRLTELKFDDIDELFSLRLDGKFRIWGIRKFGYLQILWLDKNHEICPVTY